MADHEIRGNARVRGNLVVDGSGGSGIANNYLQVRNEQAPGVNGGGITADTWTTGVLNTVVTNKISGASLSSNQITLPAGDYYVFAWGVHYDAGSMHGRVRLRDTTGSSTIIQGSNFFKNANAQVNSMTSGQFTLSVESDIELQYLHSVDGGGSTQQGININAATSVDKEVYASVELWKL